MPIVATYKASDGRYSADATYKGWTIEVATGYSIDRDAWPVVVYVSKAGGAKNKLDGQQTGQLAGESKDSALALGLDAAQQHVDAQP